MKRTQLENLLEYVIVMLGTYYDQKSAIEFPIAPDYLMEKFIKYMGRDVTPLKVYFFPHEVGEYECYIKFWHSDDTDLLRNIYLSIHRLRKSHAALQSAETMIKWFDTYYDNSTLITHDRYSHMNVKLRVEIYDKMLEKPEFGRTFKLASLNVE